MNKNIITILGIALLVAALAYPVFARGPGWGGHHMMGNWGRGSGYAWHHDRGSGNLTPEQMTQMDRFNRNFYEETADLRNEIWKKSSDLNTLLNSADPDLEKARTLQKGISDLRAQLDEKRLNYELEARKINPDHRYGGGYGRPSGRQMGGVGPGMGYGPGSCWN